MNSHSPVRTDPPSLSNPSETIKRIESFILRSTTAAGLNRAVVNLSGGIDSTVTATLATRALGSESVTGLILPSDVNEDQNIDDARQVAEELVIDYRLIELQDLINAFVKTASSETRTLQADPFSHRSSSVTVPTKHREHFPMAVGNVAARLRMAIAYFEANTTDALVVGTGNRSELLLGYFTKYGDGAADLMPIGDLYKSEVRELARALDIRETIIEKPPTAGLIEGQRDETELGAPYDRIDTILWNLSETDLTIEAIATTLEVDPMEIERLADIMERERHKRRIPLAPSMTREGEGIERTSG